MESVIEDSPYTPEEGGRPIAGLSAAESLDALKTEILKGGSLNRYLHPALDIIENYDKENQTDLLHTLQVYLENDCNAQKCGRLLFLHRNSLVYRIRRIQEISSCDLSDINERSYLRVSFFLRN